MSATAQLKFVQGGNVGAPATSLIGATGASVTASNGGDDTQNKTWTFTMVDVPLGSAVPTGVVQSGATPTFSFTPDVTGGYYLQLATVGNDNSQALDARSFGVLRASGRYIPAFMSPAAGNNFAGQLRGWAKYLEAWLIYLDGLSTVPAFSSANIGQSLMVGAGPAVLWDYAGGVRGHIDVNHATPGTLDATHQIAYCDTATGTCSVALPAPSAFPGNAIPADWKAMVVDTAGAASTGNITVTTAGQNAWDPSKQAFGATAISMSQNAVVFVYQWDLTKQHWDLVSGAGGSGGGGSTFGTVGNGGAAVVGAYTLAQTDFNTLLAAGGQVTGPLTPIKGATYRLTTASGTFETTPAAFLGNGYNVQQPDAASAYTFGISAALKASGKVYSWWWTGTEMALASW